MRQPYLVPESLGVLEALADMRKHRRAVAVVVDEYGGVAGILTVKDLLEPLVGDLHDEFDEVEEPMIVRVDGTRWLIDGQTNVDVVRERLGMDLPDGEYVTLGGLLFERFGHIPAEGEQVHVGDWDLRVVEMDKRRVAQVVATSLGATPSDPDRRRSPGLRRLRWRACFLRGADGLWRSLVSALRSGRRGPRFKSGQPDHESLVRASGFLGPWTLPGPDLPVDGGAELCTTVTVERIPDQLAPAITSDDPAGQPVEGVRPIVDDIDRRVRRAHGGAVAIGRARMTRV